MTPARWFRGDCHVHSRYSDGALEPGELLDGARDHGMDFVVATEHNLMTPVQWQQDPSDLLVMCGQEVTTPNGHWLALGLRPGHLIEWRYGIDDGRIVDELGAVRAGGGLCVAAHPVAPYPGGTCAYPLEQFDLVEVWNGRWDSDLAWQADNETTFARWKRDLAEHAEGRWRPAIGNSDAHLDGQIAHPHTVVRATERTTKALLDGLRTGRSWLAASSAVALAVSVQAGDRVAEIGDTLSAGDRPATLTVAVDGVPGGRLTVHTDSGPMQIWDLDEQRHDLVADVTGARLVWAEVRFADRTMAAISNPVFLTLAGSALPVTGDPVP